MIGSFEFPSDFGFDGGVIRNCHLARLALTYLTEQVRHWPDLARGGEIPRPTPDNAAALARAFRARQERGEIGPLDGWLGSMTIAAAYLRFSDENSNPRSLDDQLVNVLARAAADRQSIPWEYVFADFAVTGTNARRERRDIDVRIREAEAARARTATPLTEAGVRAMLGRLREVLNQDVAVAAPVLRKLLGRIEVRQKARENKKDRATWLLRFKPTLAQAALEVEVGSGCPDRTTWEFLCGANWIPEPEVEVVVAYGLPKYAEYREVVVQRINGGETGEAVARSLGISRGAGVPQADARGAEDAVRLPPPRARQSIGVQMIPLQMCQAQVPGAQEPDHLIRIPCLPVWCVPVLPGAPVIRARASLRPSRRPASGPRRRRA